MEKVELMALQMVSLNLSIARDCLKIDEKQTADEKIFAALSRIQDMVDRQKEKAKESLDFIESL